MAGAVGAHMSAAGLAVDVGGDGLQHGTQTVVGLGGPPGHDRGAEQGALLSPGDAHAHEVQAALAQGLLPAAGVGVEGVAGIDDDVARLHEGGELLDHGLSGGSGLHHDDGHAWGAQGGDEVLQVAGGYEVALGAVALHEPLGTGQGAVEHRHRVPVAGEVARQVGPHHPQSEHAEVCRGRCGGEVAHMLPFLLAKTGGRHGCAQMRLVENLTATAIRRAARVLGPRCSITGR